MIRPDKRSAPRPDKSVAKRPNRQAALRALFEGAPASIELLAGATGRSPASLSRLALREGWTPRRLQARLTRLVESLLTEIEQLMHGKRRGPLELDKSKIDTLSAMARAVVRVGDTLRDREAVKEEQEKREADMATTLKRIDERIVELARDHAEVLLRKRSPAR